MIYESSIKYLKNKRADKKQSSNKVSALEVKEKSHVMGSPV